MENGWPLLCPAFSSEMQLAFKFSPPPPPTSRCIRNLWVLLCDLCIARRKSEWRNGDGNWNMAIRLRSTQLQGGTARRIFLRRKCAHRLRVKSRTHSHALSWSSVCRGFTRGWNFFIAVSFYCRPVQVRRRPLVFYLFNFSALDVRVHVAGCLARKRDEGLRTQSPEPSRIPPNPVIDSGRSTCEVIDMALLPAR